MDFTNADSTIGRPGVYTEHDPTILPPLYLAYNVAEGGDSGKVHSTVRDRWQQKEPELVTGKY